MKKYFCVSFSHKSAGVDLRSRLYLEDAKKFLQSFFDKNDSANDVEEIFVLSTCNRTEFYVYSTSNPREKILSALNISRGIEMAVLESSSLFYSGEDAICHIFKVASGCESIALGETQILAQLKDAYKICASFCGERLESLMNHAIRCSASVRNLTAISSSQISIASLAVMDAKERLKILKAQASDKDMPSALVIGLGEMGRICAKHLLKALFRVTICNKSIQKSLDFKAKNKVDVLSLDELASRINEFDFVFSATSSQNFVITKDMIANTQKPRFYYDLAIPRDIDDLDFIQTIRIDDLQERSNANLAKRETELKAALEIIQEKVQDFKMHLETLFIEPLIKDVRALAREASLRELSRAIKRGFIPREREESVKKILHQAFNVFLHPPTVTLRKLAQSGDLESIEVIERFFKGRK